MTNKFNIGDTVIFSREDYVGCEYCDKCNNLVDKFETKETEHIVEAVHCSWYKGGEVSYTYNLSNRLAQAPECSLKGKA